MRSSLALFAVILAAGFLSSARALESRPEMTLILKERAVVSGPEILLGDVADLQPSDRAEVAGLAHLPMGSSPIPGETRIVTRTDVSKALGTTSVPDVEVSGAAQVRISRSSRPLAEADVVPVLRSHVAAITVWRPEEIEIRAIGNLKGVEIPDGNITFRFAQKSAPSNFRNLLLPLEVSVGGRPVRTVWITADVHINATVMQAARKLPYGAALAGDDVRPVRIEIPDPRAAYVRSAEAAAGKVLRRSLKPGELITEDALSDPLIVRSGDTVRLRLEQSNLHMVMQARAEQNGRMGQSIRVRNLEFARILKAMVVGPGEVLIR